MYLICIFRKWSVSICVIYLFASLSFAPFVDDGYYYYNIQTIWSGNINNDINYTLYEFVVAIVYAPLLLVFKNIEHYMLLPFNWFLGTIFVTESIRFAWKIVPIKNSKKVFCSFFILLNYSCVDAFVHLYRDSLMLIFYVISLSFILKKQYDQRYHGFVINLTCERCEWNVGIIIFIV